MPTLYRVVMNVLHVTPIIRLVPDRMFPVAFVGLRCANPTYVQLRYRQGSRNRQCGPLPTTLDLSDRMLQSRPAPLTHARTTFRKSPNSKAGRCVVTLRLFISYAHEDAGLKDQLLKHLKGLERQGKIRPWEDSQIEVGSNWREAIGDAMARCDIALFLISQGLHRLRFH